MSPELAVIYSIFGILGGSFGCYALKIWLSRNNEITKIRQNGNNVKEFLELRDEHLALKNAYTTLKTRFKNLKDEGLDLDDLDIDEDDSDDEKLSKIAKSFGVPKGIAAALDNKELQEGIGDLLKKNSGPVLNLVDDWLSKKTPKNDHNNIGQESLGV